MVLQNLQRKDLSMHQDLTKTRTHLTHPHKQDAALQRQVERAESPTSENDDLLSDLNGLMHQKDAQVSKLEKRLAVESSHRHEAAKARAALEERMQQKDEQIDTLQKRLDDEITQRHRVAAELASGIQKQKEADAAACLRDQQLEELLQQKDATISGLEGSVAEKVD